MGSFVYLDYNATAPIFPEAADAVREASLRFVGNPSSQHAAGRQARRALEDARERIGELLGARLGSRDGDRLVFTSGGTEANNLALYGIAAGLGDGAASASRERRALFSPAEHPSVANVGAALRRQGWKVDLLPLSPTGVIPTDGLDEWAKASVALVSVTMAPSETGVLQPIAELVAALGNDATIFHTDAVQVVGKEEVDFRRLGVDTFACAAHKFHGPLGIGALVLGPRAQLTPWMTGGAQQDGLRPGSETTALAIGMRCALELCTATAVEVRQRTAELRDRLERGLQQICPQLAVLGGGALRLPNTSNVSFPGLDRQALVMALDQQGIACSIGLACASGAPQRSATHQAMGLSDAIQQGAVRFSLGRYTTTTEIDDALCRISLVYKRLRRD